MLQHNGDVLFSGGDACTGELAVWGGLPGAGGCRNAPRYSRVVPLLHLTVTVTDQRVYR